MGRYCGYLLLKHDGGTSKIKVNPTKVLDHQSHPVLPPEIYIIHALSHQLPVSDRHRPFDIVLQYIPLVRPTDVRPSQM